MPIVPFGEYRPDVSDYEGQTTATILNVLPRGDGYGPFRAHANYSSALPGLCRGFFYARKNDGSIAVFAGTETDLFTLDNTTLTWETASKPTALTSITNASPAVLSLTGHGLSAGDPVVLSTSGSLPTGFTAGTVYYVISAGLTADEFELSATSGGSAINTSSAGSGTHSVTTHYSSLSSTANWQFAQFNNYVVAVQVNTAPQVYDLTSSSAFADLGGSPPNAAYISVVNRFLVLSGLASPNVYRIQWSGLNATTTWTSGVGQSDYQDLPDGGIVRGVAGGEFGTVFQDSSIRTLTYAPGSPYIFGITRIAQDDGIYAPYSLIAAQDRVLYCSQQGFKMITPGAYPVAIGKERVDRTFFAEIDTANLQLMIGASDPRSTRAYWAYKSINGGVASNFDKILVYDWALDKWAKIEMTGEYLATLSQPGITLENVDAAYGSNIDTIVIPSLDSISTSVQSQLSAVDTDHKLGFYTGAPLEATMVSSEHGADGNRIFVRGFRPVSDSPTVYGSISYRDTSQDAAVYTSETLVNAVGICTARKSTRYSRGKVRIPAGTEWTYAAGIEPDVVLDGAR